MPHLSEIVPPGRPLYSRPNPAVGDTVVIYSRGRYRTAEVLKVGRSRVQVEYTTGSGYVTRPYVPLGKVYDVARFADDAERVGTVAAHTGRDRRGGHYLDPA